MSISITNWRFAYGQNKDCRDFVLTTPKEIEASALKNIRADVPGNFELDLMREGLIYDLYYSENTLKAQELENYHLWYYTTFDAPNTDSHILFEGIDTFSDIYVNGELVKSTDNMFTPVEVYAPLKAKGNTLVVHIKPAVIEARKYPLESRIWAQRYSNESLYVRKAPHMYGWDIAPRIVSGGLWKSVLLCENKKEKINEYYIYPIEMDHAGSKVRLAIYLDCDIEGDFADEYSFRLYGKCKDSVIDYTSVLRHTSAVCHEVFENVYLWYPKNYGEQNLYSMTLELMHGDKVIDTKSFNYGVRTIELKMTPVTDKDGNGDFSFCVNGRRIFCNGTNHVPLDAFHSNDINRLPKYLEMLKDIGCNIIRMWGGNVYEADELYDFCDKNGILVWQDFSMACGFYPQDDGFCKMLEKEAEYQVKRLRNHPCIAVFAGDNECDEVIKWARREADPADNVLTRQVLKRVVVRHAPKIPYLPSSPYISPEAYKTGGVLPECHLWGPRDYFKGKFYKDTFTHFASETGYHGFNSVQSLKKFLKNPEKLFNEDGTPTLEYLVHSSSPEADPKAPFAYRIRLAYKQVETLFGKASGNLEDFVKQSQISQAEAKKYFIEKFRVDSKRRSGIIWWNLLDCWPQVSDAVVDYYYTKKLAYHYIKRSQEPVMMTFDEPENGKASLMLCNENDNDVTVKYSVKNMYTDEVVMTGVASTKAHTVIKASYLDVGDEKEFYYISWETSDGKKGFNHYFTNIIDIDYNKYMEALKKCNMDEFEGM